MMSSDGGLGLAEKQGRVLTGKGGDRVSDHHASLPIAYWLYLPNKWAEHAGRRKKAHVPQDIDFKIEPRPARADP